jgi:hypothetical protein
LLVYGKTRYQKLFATQQQQQQQQQKNENPTKQKVELNDSIDW